LFLMILSDFKCKIILFRRLLFKKTYMNNLSEAEKDILYD